MAHIRLRRTIPADKSTVFDALTIQEYISGWFAPHVIATPVSGTYAAFAFDEDQYFKVLLSEIVRDEKIVWEYTGGNLEWDHSRIVFRLEETGKGKTLLTFSQSELPDTGKVDKWRNSWSNFLDQLKRFVLKELSHA
jgi:uncharacterized protein YndB with AHSA1/START domain